MLTDLQIVARLVREDSRKLTITPMISAKEQIGPSSVDVHLGTEFMVVERSDTDHFDPLMSSIEYDEWLKHVRLTSRYSVTDHFILHPGEFALGLTLEFIGLPSDIIGHIDGRSSWARQGLKVHSTAGNIHPGSKGFVVFELENVGPVPIWLYPGLAIAQLTFDELGDAVLEDYSTRPMSRYSTFAQTLWSAYPRDIMLQAMRRLRPSSSRATGSRPQDKRERTDAEPRRFVALRQSEGTGFEMDGDGTFSVERRYLLKNQASIQKSFSGQFVAIVGERIVDNDSDMMALSQRTFTRFQHRPVFMPFVSPEGFQPLVFGGPRRIDE